MGKTYAHAGDLGDLIASLCAIKQLGGGRLVLYPAACTGHRMTYERAQTARSLLEAQDYIESVEWRPDARGVDLVLDLWRGRYDRTKNLADMVSAWLGLPAYDREEPWITVPQPRRVASVIFTRSPRYNNWATYPTWLCAWEEYHLDSVFCGLPEEHADFCRSVGPVSYYHTPTLLDLASVLAGAQLHCGNQSAPHWLAQALRLPLCCEQAEPCNTHYQRPGAVYWSNAHGHVPTLESLSGKQDQQP